MYIAVANTSTGDFSFYDGNGQVLSTPVPQDARFFSIAFIDPSHPDSAPLDFDPVSTMELPIWEKGDELALAITAIKQITGVPKVILIAHSMGGLDARSYLENLGSLGSHKPGVDTDVLDLTSIDTPHLGSPLAALSSIIPYSPWDQCILEGSEDIDELAPGSQTMTDLNYGSGQAQDIPSTVSFDALVDYVPLYNLDYLVSPYSAEDPVYLAWGQGVSNDGAVSRDSQNMSNAVTAYPFAHRPTITVTDTPFLSYCPISENPYFPKLLHDLGCVGVQESTQLQLKVDIINNLLQNSIDVEPQNVVLNPGQTQQFSVSLNGAVPSVQYVLLEDPTSPVITSRGLFTASDTGVYHVVATDTAAGKQYGMATVTVNPTPQSSTLQVIFAGGGSGGVTSTPQGISCRSNCSFAFPSNTSVTLTAWPDSGMVVSGWSGCSTQTASTCTVSMASSTSVTVTFVTQQSNQLSPPTLNAVQISGSAISPLGTFSWSQVAHNVGYRILVSNQRSALPTDPNASVCISTCQINQYPDPNVTSYTSTANALAPGTTYYWQVHARAGTGYSPGVWSNVGTFSTSQSPGQIQVGFQGSGAGTVTSSPPGINCPGVCLASFPANTAVTLSSSPSTGSQFLQWGGACAGATCTVSATGVQTVIANFNLSANYTLNLGLSGTGTITSADGKINCTGLSGTCSASYPNGTTVVLNSTPGPNYTFAGWSGACSGAGSCSVAMNQNQFVMAAFNVSSTPNGQLTVSSSSFAPVFNQGTAPAVIGLLVKNSSGGPMLGTAVASEQSGGAWMTVDGGASDGWTAPETLTITFNPAGLSPGIYNGAITLTSSQATNSPVVVPVTLTVLTPLIITSQSNLPDAFSGKLYSTTLQASGGDGALTWSVDPNALPFGLTLNSATGVISGTVGNIGGNSALTFVISVTDSRSRLAQQTFTMNWRQGVDIYLWDNSLLQMGVGNPLYQSAGNSFIATGGTAPYTWSASGLPPGVSLSSAGVFSGSPTTLGQFNIVLTATDSTGLSGGLTLTTTTFETLLQIYDSSQNTPPLLKPLVLGTPLSASEYFEAAGGTQTGYTWTINGALPPGIAGGPAPGCTGSCALIFTGTPTKAGTYTFVVQVTDSQNNSTTSSQTWVVNSDGNGPTISTTTLPQATIGVGYTQQLAASGGKVPLTWTVLSGHLDSNLSVSSSGSLSGTPGGTNECANGASLAPRGSVPSTFVVEVTDANGESDVQQLCVTSYFPQPTIQAVTPTIVSDGTAKTITVTGKGFQPLSELFVQYNQQPTVYVSPTELQVTLQPGTGSPFILAGGSQISPGNWQIRVQAPYTMPSNFGSFAIALPPPTVTGVQSSLYKSSAPCTPNFICYFLITGSGFSWQTTFQVVGSSQYIGSDQAPQTVEPWTQITATNFVPPQAGTYTVQVTNPNQANGGSASASGTFQVYDNGTIVPAPTSFAPSFTQGDAGSSTSLLLQVAGISSIPGTLTASTQAGGNWLTVGGQLSGSWTAGQALSVSFNPAGLPVGNYSGVITLTANLQGGPGPITVPVNMTVLPPLSILTPSNLPDAQAGQAYTTTLAGTGGKGSIWSVVQGSLPTGLSIDPNTGIISGTPSSVGGSNTDFFTIGLQDSFDRSTSRVFSMVVTAVAKTTPTITWATPAAITYGTALSGTQLNPTASVPGTFSYSPAQGTVLNAGSQSLIANFTPNDTTDYNTASATVTLTVNKATPTITWNTPAPVTVGTALSATQLNPSASVAGSFSYNPVSGTVMSTAGNITLTATFVPNDTTDYNNNSVTVTLVVNSVTKTTPTITWATPTAITYGTALSGTQLNPTASVPGSFSYSPAQGTVLNAGSQTLTANFTPTDTTDYNTASATVTLTVNTAAPTITWNTPAAITYGTNLGAAQLDATASIAGSFSYLPALGTFLTAGSQTLSVTFTPTDTTDYTTATSTVQLTINKATPTITWATPAAITYGTALSAGQLDATSTVVGTFVYAPATGTVLGAGAQALSVTFTPTDATDYNTAPATVTLTVSKATPTITWSTPAAVTVGTALSATQLDATASVPGSFVYGPTAGTVMSTAGNTTLAATFTPTDTTDYSNASASVVLTVNPVTKTTPTITWGTPAAITYGTALSATQLDATASVAGSFSYSAAQGTVLNAGLQTVSVTFTPTDTTDYNTTTATIQLTVNKATPTITWATPAAITYGTALSTTQLDATASVAGALTYSPSVGTVLTAGSQALTANFTPTDTTDYNTASATVTLTVNKATPTITWSTPAAVTVGSALSATQLDATASVPGSFVYNPTSGTVMSTAGNTTLSATFTPTDTTDYNSASATIVLIVNPATKTTPTITWSTPAAITYGTALSATQLNATASVAGSFSYAPSVGTVLTAGSQTLSVTFTPTDTTDYNSAQASVTLTVNKATPTITWSTPAAVTVGTALSATQLDATASVPGSFVYNPTTGTVMSTAGNTTLSATFTPTDTTDYNSASATVVLTVNPAVSPGFTISGTAVSVTPGATAANASTITLTPAGGFTGSVALTATVTSSPAGAQDLPTLSFGSTTPVSISGTSAGTATLTISTTAATSGTLLYPKRHGVPWYAAGGATLTCFLLFGVPARRRRWKSMLGMVVLLVLVAGGAVACGGGGGGGGGGGSGGGGGGGNSGTTAGAYTITVTGTSGSTTASGIVTLTVQ
jgi:pimeloyl-ACP methyl ester carboxylesterase